MSKQIYALTAQHIESTMTLKEITDILGVRHDNAMRTVAAMTEDVAFGSSPQIEEKIDTGKGGERFITTYKLTKRQSIAVAAKLNTSLLMHIIDRWQALEDAEAARREEETAKLEAALSKSEAAFRHLEFQIITSRSAIRADMFDWKIRFIPLIHAASKKPDMYGRKHTPSEAVAMLAPYAEEAMRLIELALQARPGFGTALLKSGVENEVAYRVLQEYDKYLMEKAREAAQESMDGN